MNEIERMYQELINDSNEYNSQLPSYNGPSSQYDDPDDMEMFITSKEISKAKEVLGADNEPTRGGGDGRIEESVHFKRYTKRREHKYTEEEMKNIKESCKTTIVHDYGEYDIYHMSDEDRKKNDMLAELSMKLGGLKRTYRKVDQYIEAMRIVVQAWELLEKNNYIHTSDEFFKMVAEGRIVSNRIIMPKLKKMDNYNIDLIIQYISNPELDPSDLVAKKPVVRDPWYDEFEDENEDDETEEEETERLLSQDELEYILKNIDNPPEIKVENIKPKFVKGYDKRSFTSSPKKKLSKNERYIQQSLHDLLNKIQSNPEFSSNTDYGRSYLITNSMFEADETPKDNFWDKLYFDGSFASKEDNYLYDLAVREELLKQHPANERYLTYQDQELKRFFKILEDNGINTVDLRRKMNATTDATRMEEAKMSKKENKKLESEIIQRITKLNNNPKFKKLVGKAEKALNKYYEDN